jgi:hypothetical protein
MLIQNQLSQLRGNTSQEQKSRKKIKNWSNRGTASTNISTTDQKEVLPGDILYTIRRRIEC